MSAWKEPAPEIIAPVPAGTDSLGESVLCVEAPWCTVFEPQTTCVVIGRYQQVEREVHVDHARADGVPIHRRATGGGAVVLAPGMLVLGLRLRPGRLGSTYCFDRINAALAPAIDEVCGRRPITRGHGDLALQRDTSERKILGASLRVRGDYAFYLGVLLCSDAVPLMERYLRPPSRRPAYRGKRDHRQFCTSLDLEPTRIPRLRSALSGYLERTLSDIQG